MRLLLAALLLALAGCGRQSTDATPPIVRTKTGEIALTGRVVDRADIISPAEEREITERLATLERDTSDQLVVVTLKSLNGSSIDQVSRALGNGWAIGRADVDNGVLIVVAPNDKKVRIQVGTGLEGLLTDQRAAAIIDEMLPSFRADRPTDAIRRGVDEISTVLRSDKRRPKRLLKEAA